MTRKLINCLNSELVKIYKQAANLEAIEALVIKYLPKQCQGKTKVKSYKQGTLTLSTQNAEVAHELRYLLPDIRDKLRQKHEMFHLVQIKLSMQAS